MMLLAAASSFMIFMTTERCFESADDRNAISMVQNLRATPQAMTIPDAVLLAHPTAKRDDLTWSASLTDEFYGFVRVTLAVNAPHDHATYLFDVDLTGNRLHPANDAAGTLMKQLGGETLSSAGSKD